MAHANGRIVEQRQIARIIWNLRKRQKIHRQKWIDLDIQINALQMKLDKPVRFRNKDGTLKKLNKR